MSLAVSPETRVPRVALSPLPSACILDVDVRVAAEFGLLLAVNQAGVVGALDVVPRVSLSLAPREHLAHMENRILELDVVALASQHAEQDGGDHQRAVAEHCC